MKAFYQDFKLGIIGGGQLGRMLLQVCPNFDVYTCVLDPSPDAPCSGLANEFVQGSLQDYETVYQFGRKLDLITIEIENINVAALYQLEREGVTVYPQAHIIEIIQDKRKQKQFYLDHQIPTADFILTESRDDIRQHADFLPAFNKLGIGGYDGGGVVRLDDSKDVEKGFDAPGMLEKLVDLDREISVIAARNLKGDVAVYPAVECVFHADYNLVDYLISPSLLDAEIQNQALSIARHLVEELQIVGLLAVEMFITKNGQVLVNEVAPRPHNSGHQTINANVTSQYEQHLRAILNLPLGSTAVNKASAMVNLLGEEGYTGPVTYLGLDKVLLIPGVNLFLYGKKQTKPYRKMGHITIVDDDIETVKAKMAIVKKTVRVISQ